jgi:hypothetical protein
MLVHGIELQFVNIDVLVHLLEEATCRTHILYDEMADAQYHFFVVRRQYPLNGGIAQQYGYQV